MKDDGAAFVELMCRINTARARLLADDPSGGKGPDELDALLGPKSLQPRVSETC